MEKFRLIHELQHGKLEEPNLQPYKSYQQYEVQFDKQTIFVWIPIRETQNFELTLTTVDSLTEETLKKILRKYRGIKNIK